MLFLLFTLLGRTAAAVEPMAVEVGVARRWIETHLEAGQATSLPFSFRLGGKPSRALLSAREVERTVREAGPACTERTIRVADPDTGLEVRCVALVYHDLPAVEWVLHFTNRGRADTPIIDEMHALDGEFGPGVEGQPCTLYYAEGSHEKITDFQPRQDTIGHGDRLKLSAFGGRSSDGTLPFFNLAMPKGGGVAIGVGWTGQWAASFERVGAGPVRVQAGMEQTHTIMKFLLWFEPERVMLGTWLHAHHSEWLLRPTDSMPSELKYQVTDGFHLFDLGNPQALAWLEAKLSGMVRDVEIDVFRNDFNMYPLYYWTNAEPVDRQGMREIPYVTGLYHLFDTLRREHPGLLLDNCASGGRRIDFEMLRRALVLTRSDYLWDPIGQQCHTLGLAQWVPITGIGAASLDVYSARSGLGSHFSLAADYGSRDPSVWGAVARDVAEFQELRRYFTGDFYPLGPYSTSGTAWMGWQFHRDDLGEGLVQAFRRQECPDKVRKFRLQGLDSSAEYVVTDRDANLSLRMSGRALMEQGWTFRLPEKRSAAIVTYRNAGATR